MSEGENPYSSPVSEEGLASGESAVVDPDARLWGMLCHLSALSAYFTGIGGIVGPLAIWLIKKNDHPFVDDQGKESVNFQISMLIYHLVAGAAFLCLIGLPLLICLVIANIVLVVMASIKANQGIRYRYPLTIRFIR